MQTPIDINKIDAYVPSRVGPSTPVYFVKRTKNEIHAVRTGFNAGTEWNHETHTARIQIFTCRRSTYSTTETWTQKGETGFRAADLIFDVEGETKKIAAYHARRECASKGIELAQEIEKGLRWFAHANLDYCITPAHVAWLTQIRDLVKQCPSS
jgi:hypothetical protein